MRACDVCRRPILERDNGARVIHASIATGMKAGTGDGREVEACGACVRRGFTIHVRPGRLALAKPRAEAC